MCKLCSTYGCAFTHNFMIKPENLKNVLYLRLSIIIRGEVYICRSSDAKNLCKCSLDWWWTLFRIPNTNSSIGSLKFSNRSAQSFTSNILGINVVPKVKFDYSIHHSRSFLKNARVCLWIKRSLESFTVWVLRWTVSPFWNRRWWNINYNLFSSRGMARHLQKNRQTAKNQVQNHKTQTSTWLDPC